MKIINVLFFLYITTTACAQDTTLYNDTFKVYCKGEIVDGKKQGKWICSDIAGNTTEVELYKNGLKDGSCKYFLNKYLTSQGNYKNGERCGVWREYYVSGHEIMIGKYKNGVKTGKWYTYENDDIELYGFSYRKLKKKCHLKKIVEYQNGNLVSGCVQSVT